VAAHADVLHTHVVGVQHDLELGALAPSTGASGPVVGGDAQRRMPAARTANVHHMPVWMHPTRSGSRADYPNEDKSKYEIWQVLGWPMETSVAMSRMVFSGLLERLPNLRLITHHCGGMLPYFSGRAETLWAQLGSRSVDGSEADVLKSLSKPPIEYFKMFYGDTVLGGSSSALRCGLDFFGADKVVFASDCPFDPEEGPMFIREGIRSIEDLKLDKEDARKLYFGNAYKLLGLSHLG
jgi:aminocarboxymuconate-semialdehyde decarboxylase